MVVEEVQKEEVQKKPSLIKRAKKSEAYLKLGIAGPSGSGKTYSSLLIAKGLLGSLEEVVVLDTENGSANLYEHLGNYGVLDFKPPFDPKRYVKAIQLCADSGAKLIIIDSASHEWDGQGGCLDIHQKMGGKFQDWAKVTPLHKEFIDAILQVPCHVIVTMRKKQDYQMVEVGGRTKVEKVGLKEIQRDGFEYELTTNFEMQMNHLATASKDRTNLFSTEIPFKVDESIGQKLREWNK